MKSCTMAVSLVFAALVLGLAASGTALADWTYGDPDWDGAGDEWGTNEECPSIKFDQDGIDSLGWASIGIQANVCDDEEHDEHEGIGVHARVGTRELSAAEEEAPGEGSVNGGGGRGYKRWQVDPADSMSEGTWEADILEADHITGTDPDECTHDTGFQPVFKLEPNWAASCEGTGIHDGDEAELLCCVSARVSGPEHPQEGDAGAHQSTATTTFDVSISPE